MIYILFVWSNFGLIKFEVIANNLDNKMKNGRSNQDDDNAGEGWKIKKKGKGQSTNNIIYLVKRKPTLAWFNVDPSFDKTFNKVPKNSTKTHKQSQYN